MITYIQYMYVHVSVHVEVNKQKKLHSLLEALIATPSYFEYSKESVLSNCLIQAFVVS